MTMFRPTRGARVSQPARTTMPGSSWNPTSIQSPQPMPRQNPGVQTTNPGGGSVMDGGAPQQPRQPSQNAQLSSGFQREQPPQVPAQQFAPLPNMAPAGVGAMIDPAMQRAGGTMNNMANAGNQLGDIDFSSDQAFANSVQNWIASGRPVTSALISQAARFFPGNQQLLDAVVRAASGGGFYYSRPADTDILADLANAGPPENQAPPMANPPENTTPAPNLPQPPMRYRPDGPSPDKGMGGGMSRPQQPAPMQTQLPGQWNPTVGTIYDRPGMGPGYGAEPPLQRAADIDYAARRYTVRTPGVNRTTGNGIFTGR